MRSKILATFVTLAALVATPAIASAAEGSGNAPAKVHAKGDSSDKGERASFPMPAPAFKQKVDGRLAKARVRMEKRAAKLGGEEAKDLRAKFDAGAAQVNQEVAKATADGTVTKDEAKRVREAARAIVGHHGKHARRHGKAARAKK